MIGSVKRFEDLEVWQEAQLFAVEVYRVTNTFPKSEIYGMTSQLRRASSSVSANIAEGFGRVTVNDKLHFYTIAYGSLLESKNFLYLAQKLGYLEQAILDSLLKHSLQCQKLINGSKRWLANQ